MWIYIFYLQSQVYFFMVLFLVFMHSSYCKCTQLHYSLCLSIEEFRDSCHVFPPCITGVPGSDPCWSHPANRLRSTTTSNHRLACVGRIQSLKWLFLCSFKVSYTKWTFLWWFLRPKRGSSLHHTPHPESPSGETLQPFSQLWFHLIPFLHMCQSCLLSPPPPSHIQGPVYRFVRRAAFPR